ncbi:ABC transporter substrate-binding protein [Albibacillus kandeliae]|uniref:ABC transporter substrate-binding protein n=1 Tax=Albibacillus kandeliae TaxID=2174228 RepID=UPI000D697472|nr:ABC transporter substrate-binding protein [Albibacillus kandeliae]
MTHKTKVAAAILTATTLLGAPAAFADITLGAVIPLSGSNATPGEDQRRGIEIAVKEINDAGGILGEPLKVIIEDSAGKPQTAIDAARKLVTVDKVPLVIGSYSSGITLPMGEYLVQEGIPHLNPASTSGLVRKIGPTSFSMVGLDNVSTEFAAKEVIANGWKNVAVLAVNNAFGQGVAHEFEKHLEEMGGDVKTSVLFTGGQPSYRRELQQLEATDPDAYVFTAYGTDAALIMQESYELGLQTDAPWYSILITMMNKDTAAEFKQGLTGMDVGYLGAGGEGYKAAYEAAYGEGFLSAYGGYAHDAVLFAAKAIEMAGTTDKEPLLEAIRKLGDEGFDGATGEIKLDADGQRMSQPYLKFKVDGNALVPMD